MTQAAWDSVQVAGRKGKRRKASPSDDQSDRMYKNTPLLTRLSPWLFIWPPVVLRILFSIIPFINTIRLSFTDSTLLRPGKFVGLEQYIRVFHDPRVGTALLNSTVYALVVAPLMMILPLIIAVLVSGKGRLVGLFRTAFYIPVVAGSIITGLIWTNLLSARGLVNSVFNTLHWIQQPIPFLTDRWLLLFSCMAVTLWTGIGSNMVIYLASLANISPSLYEAADIDGAGALRKFTSITMPGVRSTMVMILLLSTISAFRVFNEVYLFTNGTGGIGGQDRTMSMLIMQEGTGLTARTGYASAISIIMFFLLGSAILLQIVVQKRMEK